MKGITTLGLAIGLTLGVGSSAQAQDEAPKARPERGAFIDENADGIHDRIARGHRQMGRMAKADRESALSEEQQAALKGLISELRLFLFTNSYNYPTKLLQIMPVFSRKFYRGQNQWRIAIRLPE